MKQAIKRCPFCGKKTDKVMLHGNEFDVVVHAPGCHMYQTFPSIIDVESWNKRPCEADLLAACEKALHALELVKDEPEVVDHPHYAETIHHAKAAIAKAKGEKG